MENLLKNLKPVLNKNNTSTRHPKCKGFKTPDYGWGSDYDCEYGSKLDCGECKYGGGRKNPEAKCNQ